MIRLVLLSVLLLAGLQEGAEAHPGDHEALASLEREALSGSAPARVQRVLLLAHMGAHEEALRSAQALPEATDLLFGRLALARGDAELAVMQLSSFIRTHRNTAAAYLMRSEAFKILGDSHAATADFARALQLKQRRNAPDFLRLAELQQSASPGRIEGVIETLDRGLAELPNNVLLQSAAVDLELARDRPDAALKRWLSLESPLNRSPRWRLRMAELLNAAGAALQARKHLDELIHDLERSRPTAARIALLDKARDLRTSIIAT